MIKSVRSLTQVNSRVSKASQKKENLQEGFEGGNKGGITNRLEETVPGIRGNRRALYGKEWG